jgi:hypothetical protein
MSELHSTGYSGNGKRRVISAESIAKRRYYPLDERDVDAAAWVLRQLDVAPTDKLAAFVFSTTPARVAKARRLLDQRNRRNGGHHPGHHLDRGDHHDVLHGEQVHNGNGGPASTPTNFSLELVDSPEGRRDFLQQVQLLFRRLDARRAATVPAVAAE